MITNEEEKLRNALTFTESVVPDRISADAEAIENGLANLVLSIVELVRKLLERQALRRMDSGNLSEDEIDRLGLVDRADDEPKLNRQQLDVRQRYFDVTRDDEAFVENLVEDVDQTLRLSLQPSPIFDWQSVPP